MKFTAPPGVFDITPLNEQEKWKSSYLWNYVETTMRALAHEYGFQEIRTPLFERTELFQRGVGEGSDIVSKEMYTFIDRGGRSMSLRPEGTAPAIRSLIENQLHQKLPIQKLFYIAPMFRYERSQAGRYRQHHQFGVEAIGSATPEQDAEVIALLFTLYQRLGIKQVNLYLNSIGDMPSRQSFRTALMTYLQPHLSELSTDSQTRFHTNPLRILDSKDPQDQKIVAKAPSILDFLNQESRAHFEKLQECLTLLEIPFQINSLLVRGLDYYNQTVFEFVAGDLGAQNSVGGGGRYDGLIQELGGPNLPAFGFGTGIERILQTMINQSVSIPQPPHPTIFLVPMGEKARRFSLKLLHNLRNHNIPAQMEFSDRKIGKVLQYADQIGATYTIVIGENELESEQVEIKEMTTGKKSNVTLADFNNPAMIQKLKEEKL